MDGVKIHATDVLIDADILRVKSSKLDIKSITDNYKFRWKWSYFYNWKKAYTRWKFCRDLRSTITTMADQMKDEIDNEILHRIYGSSRNNVTN